MLETLNYRVDLMQEDVVERFSPTVSPNSAVRSPLSDSDAVLFASQDLLEDFELPPIAPKHTEVPVLLQMSFKQLELLFAALPLSYSQEAVLQIRHLQTTLSCIFHLKEDSVMSSSITTSASDIYNVIQIQKLLNESNITWRDCRSSLSIVDTVNADVIQHGLGWLQDRLPVLLGRFFMMVNVVASVVKCSCVCGCTTKLTCVDTYAEATIVCRKVFGACSLCGVVCATCLADDHHYCHRPQCYCVVRL